MAPLRRHGLQIVPQCRISVTSAAPINFREEKFSERIRNEVNDDNVIIILRGEGSKTISTPRHLNGVASCHNSLPLACLVGRGKQQATRHVRDATAAGLVNQRAKQTPPVPQWRFRHWPRQPRAAASPVSPQGCYHRWPDRPAAAQRASRNHSHPPSLSSQAERNSRRPAISVMLLPTSRVPPPLA